LYLSIFNSINLSNDISSYLYFYLRYSADYKDWATVEYATSWSLKANNPTFCIAVQLQWVILKCRSTRKEYKSGRKVPSLKGVFLKNERGYRLTAKNKRFWWLLILLLSVASIRRKLLKTTYTKERNVHTNWENCNIRLGSY